MGNLIAVYKHYVNGKVCYAAIWDGDREWIEQAWKNVGIQFQYIQSMPSDDFWKAVEKGQFRPICGEEDAPVPPPITPQPEPEPEPEVPPEEKPQVPWLWIVLIIVAFVVILWLVKKK